MLDGLLTKLNLIGLNQRARLLSFVVSQSKALGSERDKHLVSRVF